MLFIYLEFIVLEFLLIVVVFLSAIQVWVLTRVLSLNPDFFTD